MVDTYHFPYYVQKLDQDCKRSVSRRPLSLRSRKAAHTLSGKKDATIKVGDSSGGCNPLRREKRLVRVRVFHGRGVLR